MLSIAIPAATLAAALVTRLVGWFDRIYSHDDFFFAYTAWLRSLDARPGVDYFLPAFNPLAEMASPLFGVMPASFLPLNIVRAIVLVVSVALLWVTFLVTHRAAESLPWAITAAAVAAWEPYTITRIADIRPDPFGALALLSAVLVVWRASDWKRCVIGGLLVGLAATVSTKLILAVPLIAVAAAVQRRQQWVRTAVLTGAVAAIPPATYLAYRLITDGLPTVRSVMTSIGQAAGSTGGSTRQFLVTMAMATPVVWALTLAGGVLVLIRRSTQRPAAPVYVALSALFLTILFAANPFLYPYIMVLVVPLVAPWIAGLELALPASRNELWRALAILIVCAFLIASAGPALSRTVNQTNEGQRKLIEWVWKATDPHERVFDWQGMHYGRPGTFHWYIYTGLVPRYRSGTWYSAAAEWKRYGVGLIIDNYRLRWLAPRDRTFLQTHYLYTAPCVLVPGHLFARQRTPIHFETIIPGDYTIVPTGTRVFIDDRPAKNRVRLQAGRHSFAFGDSAGQVAIVFTTPRRDAAGPAPCPTTPLLPGF